MSDHELQQRVANLEFQVRQYHSSLIHLEEELHVLKTRVELAQQPRDVRYMSGGLRKR